MNPTVYSCSPISFLSVHTIGYLIIIAAILYFGWPFIEAIIIALPIPDPKDMGEKIKSFFQRNAQTTRKGTVSKKEYTKNFT